MDKETLQWVRTLVLAIAIAVVISLLAKPVVVNGQSMQPTYDDGNWLVLNRLNYLVEEPKVNDFVVFYAQNELGINEDCIKRIIAGPGDSIKIFEGNVYRNNELLTEDYLNDSYTEGDIEIIDIPKGYYFVMGDNRKVSLDSRSEVVGLVKADHIKGKIIYSISK